jgi:ABC-2 type transport system ATP-binding protein
MTTERTPTFDAPRESAFHAPSGPAIELRNLTKVFNGFKAVDDASFEVMPGEILGLLGPNGAGKTTIIHMLVGLTTPTSGCIRMFGLDLAAHRERILGSVNFSSSYVSMPYSLTVAECLKVFARLYNVRRPGPRIDELLATFGMSEVRNKQVRHLSTGQQSRLNLAKAFINDPRILLLDEPTASLDPDIADKTRSLLVQVAEQKRASILYTSHNMREMEKLSARVVFMHKGKVIATGRPSEVVQKFRGQDLEDAFIKVIRGERT